MDNIVTYDFTNVFTNFFSLFLDIIGYTFNQLDSITINGVSLLSISITIILISSIIPIVFTIPSHSATSKTSKKFRKGD